MDKRYAQATGLASTQFGALSCDDLKGLKVDAKVRSRWVALGLLDRFGPRSFVIPGSPDTWQRDGFELRTSIDDSTDESADELNQAEVLVTRKHRNIKSPTGSARHRSRYHWRTRSRSTASAA